MIPVTGDVGQENLGLSSADRLTIVEDVQIVFHSAATLDFEVDLKTAANINFLGTRRVVKLCQEIRDLKVNYFVCCKQCLLFLNSIPSSYVNLNELHYANVLPVLGSGTCIQRIRQLRIIWSWGTCLPSTVRCKWIAQAGGKIGRCYVGGRNAKYIEGPSKFLHIH